MRLALTILQRERACGQKHRALPAISLTLKRAGRTIFLQHVERTGPVAAGTANLQRRMTGPRQRRRDLRFFGIGACVGEIVAALRLDEQTTQAEEFRAVITGHPAEDFGGGPITAELCGLRRQQQRQRIAGRGLSRLLGITLGRAHIAGADRDQPAHDRALSPGLAAIAQRGRDMLGRAPQAAQYRPEQHGGQHQRDRADREHHHGCFNPPAKPGDGDITRTIGKPRLRECEQPDDDKKDYGTKHQLTAFRIRAWQARQAQFAKRYAPQRSPHCALRLS